MVERKGCQGNSLQNPASAGFSFLCVRIFAISSSCGQLQRAFIALHHILKQRAQQRQSGLLTLHIATHQPHF